MSYLYDNVLMLASSSWILQITNNLILSMLIILSSLVSSNRQGHTTSMLLSRLPNTVAVNDTLEVILFCIFLYTVIVYIINTE